jgi:5-bromo-4-chloroindolyl phosphate hydrolysis protein
MAKRNLKKELEETKKEIKEIEKRAPKAKAPKVVRRQDGGDYVIVNQSGGYVRTYTSKDHGKRAKEYAEMFAKKNGYRIIN